MFAETPDIAQPTRDRRQVLRARIALRFCPAAFLSTSGINLSSTECAAVLGGEIFDQNLLPAKITGTTHLDLGEQVEPSCEARQDPHHPHRFPPRYFRLPSPQTQVAPPPRRRQGVRISSSMPRRPTSNLFAGVLCERELCEQGRMVVDIKKSNLRGCRHLTFFIL